MADPGTCRINRLAFADNLVLLAFSEQSLPHVFDRFSAACDQVGMKAITKKADALCLCRNPSQWALYVSGSTLEQARRSTTFLVWYSRVTEGGTGRLMHTAW